MNFNFHKFSKQKLLTVYSLDLQFYTDILPEIGYKDLIKITNERIQVLKIMTSVTRDNVGKSDEDIRILITERLQKNKNYGYATLLNSKGHQSSSEQDLLNRLNDHFSFMTLLLALISSHQYYEDFQLLEERFFKLRASALDCIGLRNVASFYNKFPKINDSDKQELKPKLIRFFENPDIYEEVEIFKVPISYVLGIINPHELYFNQGMAYVPFCKIKQLLCAIFHNYLKEKVSSVNIKSLKHCRYNFGPLNLLLLNVRNDFIKMQQSTLSESKITAEDIEKLSEKSFPPCMRVIHQVFRKNHHLKHESRLQFTLFLKGIGLPVNEALKLFKTEFTKKIDAEVFEKEYRYYIEHAYGLRGSRVDYDPKCCKTIQETPTPPGDCNGCPLQIRHNTDIEELDKTLSQWKIPDSNKSNIIAESKIGNYGSACARYFETVHTCKFNKIIDHPNAFFKDSRFVVSNCLLQFPCKNEFNDADVSHNTSILISQSGIRNSENFVKDKVEASEVSDSNKRKADVALDDCQTKVPNVNKKFKTNPVDREELLNIDESQSSELIPIEKFVSTNSCDALANLENSSALTTSPDPLIRILKLAIEREEAELELIKDVAVEFDEMIPIENIKSGSIIYTPRRPN